MKVADYNSDISAAIRNKRTNLEFTPAEFATVLGLPDNTGEQKIIDIERGNLTPSKTLLELINKLPDKIPFSSSESKFTFIDLFAGIGGMRLGFQPLGGKCVFSSEWDKHAARTYAANFGEIPHGDITQIPAGEIPDHDILLAGFPCQAFSQAGQKKGFLDTRGTMFFEVQRILAEKRPKAFLLENVKQLKGHNKGQTLKTILQILRGEFESHIPEDVPLSEEARKALSVKLNYFVDFKVINARNFGVPQNRQRIYIVGFDKDYFKAAFMKDFFRFPEEKEPSVILGDILEDHSEVDPAFTITERMWQGHQERKQKHRDRGNGFGYSLFDRKSDYANTISARYWKDGSEILINQSDIGKRPRVLTPRECARLQGFPKEFFIDAVSKRYIYQQFGNSVSVPVIKALANEMLVAMNLAGNCESGPEIKNQPPKQLAFTFA